VLNDGSNASFVVIDSLSPGLGYSFTVVAVVLVNNVEQSGPPSEITPDSVITIEGLFPVLLSVYIMMYIAIIMVYIAQ